MGSREITAALAPAYLCFIACSTTPSINDVPAILPDALPFCDFIGDPKKYIDQSAVVAGLFADTPHGALVYGADCPNRAIPLRGSSKRPTDSNAAAAIRDAFRKDIGARVSVVIRGVLRSRPKVSPCLEDSCMQYELDEAQVIVAKRL